MKQLFPGLFIFALLFCAGDVSHAQTYQIINTVSSNVANNVTKTVTIVQVGSNPLNRFLMTRVRKNIPNDDLKGTILLLPPLVSCFQNYEVGDGGDYDKSFAGFLPNAITTFGATHNVCRNSRQDRVRATRLIARSWLIGEYRPSLMMSLSSASKLR